MAVTLEFEVEASMRLLRAALTATIVHAEPTKTGDEVSPLCRVRLIFGKAEILVAASNSTTTALAAVPIDDGTDTRRERFAVDDAPYIVDVGPGEVRDILQQFKCARPSADAEDAAAGLRVTGDGFFWVQDRDGLIPGKMTRYPHLSTSDTFPDVLAVLKQAMGQASSSATPKPLIAEAGPLKLFAAASVAYGRPITCEPIGAGGSRGWLVWCGPAFVGLLSSDDPGGDSLARRQAERRAHLERLGLGPTRDPLELAATEIGALDDLDEHVEADDREPAMAGS